MEEELKDARAAMQEYLATKRQEEFKRRMEAERLMRLQHPSPDPNKEPYTWV